MSVVVVGQNSVPDPLYRTIVYWRRMSARNGHSSFESLHFGQFTLSHDPLDRAIFSLVYDVCLSGLTFFKCVCLSERHYSFEPSDVHANLYSHWVQGGRGWCLQFPRPLGFCSGTSFWKYFTFNKLLVICTSRWGAYYGVWCCWDLVTSSSLYRVQNTWPPSWILLKLKIYRESAEIFTLEL